MTLFMRKSKPMRFTTADLPLLKLADEVTPLLMEAERDFVGEDLHARTIARVDP